MRNLINIGYFAITFSLLLLLLPLKAYAYIDPGTGSIIIQVVIGVLAGGLVALKIFWTKVKLFFTGKKSKLTKSEKENE